MPNDSPTNLDHLKWILKRLRGRAMLLQRCLVSRKPFEILFETRHETNRNVPSVRRLHQDHDSLMRAAIRSGFYSQLRAGLGTVIVQIQEHNALASSSR